MKVGRDIFHQNVQIHVYFQRKIDRAIELSFWKWKWGYTVPKTFKKNEATGNVLLPKSCMLEFIANKTTVPLTESHILQLI